MQHEKIRDPDLAALDHFWHVVQSDLVARGADAPDSHIYELPIERANGLYRTSRQAYHALVFVLSKMSLPKFPATRTDRVEVLHEACRHMLLANRLLLDKAPGEP